MFVTSQSALLMIECISFSALSCQVIKMFDALRFEQNTYTHLEATDKRA